MNAKHYMIAVGVTIGLLAGALGVMAQTSAPAAPMMRDKTDQQMIVQISPDGKVLLRGKVDAVSTNSLTVKSWGGDWVAVVNSSTKLAPGLSLSQFMVGDFVGVQGSINQDASWAVNATTVRNWTERKVAQDTKKEIKKIIKSESPKNWEGVASNINASTKSFTLTIEGTAYTVNVSATAKVVNFKYAALGLGDIKNGDKVRVFGPSVDAVITASVVRDTSVGQ